MTLKEMEVALGAQTLNRAPSFEKAVPISNVHDFFGIFDITLTPCLSAGIPPPLG